MKKTMFRAAAFLGTLFVATAALAEEAGASNASDEVMWRAIATALTIGLAAFGGAMAQGRAAAAALDGIARNPNAAGKIFTPLILGLALIESLVIYAWVTSFLLRP